MINAASIITPIITISIIAIIYKVSISYVLLSFTVPVLYYN